MFHFVFLSGCEQYSVFKEVQSTMPTLTKKKKKKNLPKTNLNKTHCFLFQNAFEKKTHQWIRNVLVLWVFFKKYVEYLVFSKNYG